MVMTTVSAMPVAMVPRIIARPVIHGRSIVPVVGIPVIRIARSIISGAVISRANSHSDANMHSGIGLAGEADHSHQRNDK
jgi:hypothetical protein